MERALHVGEGGSPVLTPMLVNVEADALFVAARHWESVTESTVSPGLTRSRSG